jgi:septum formation protein
MSLVLASASPRRKKLLQQLGFDLKIDPSDVEEVFDESVEPSIMARNLAGLKAEEVARRHPSEIVLGADTIVVLDGLMLSKPIDSEDAKSMLRLLSGRPHHVWTGVSLVRRDTDTHISFAECTEVQFAALSDHEIDAYVATGSPLDKAGAYGIQDDWGAVFISGIKGDYYNVVGLPLHALYLNLLKFA